MIRIIFTILFIAITFTINAQENQQKKKNRMEDKKSGFNTLTEFEENIIINKATERPFTGKFNKHKEKGTYICKQCNAPLYKSSDKFESNWRMAQFR